MMPLVLIVLVGVVVSGAATTVSTNGNLYTNVYVDDKAFSQDVIFEQPATSAQHCGALCKLQESCVTFTFNQEVCRGHAVLVTFSTPSTPAQGARSFVKESDRAAVIETTTACSSDSHCTDTNTRCFVNQCMCIQGYYYSVSSKACIETCSSLDNTYLHYKSSVMKGYNLEATPGVTVQLCLDACNADSACLVAEYSTDEILCNLQHVTARHDPSAWRDQSYPTWRFYQRNCQ